MMEWQPIETAPKDGRWLIVFAEGATVPEVAKWGKIKGETGWCDPDIDEFQPVWNVTHWMPLPAPPTQGD